MITRLFGSSVALGTIVLAGAMYVGPRRAPDSPCLDGPVPLVWPLGDTGFAAQRLLDSHGQFLQFDADPPFVHEGVDIAACPGDPVYAVEVGTVDLVSDDGGLGYAYVLVRDEDEPTSGWKYMHLKNIVVDETDVVQRDQLLGEVVEFPETTGFDHLHLERMAVKSGSSKLDLMARSGGNPLEWLTARSDASPPQRMAFGPPHLPAVGFLFFEVPGGGPVAPANLAGKTVDIVARVSETFPGAGAPACDGIASSCGASATPMEIMPVRISLGIFQELDSPTGTVDRHITLKRVFHNVIDLTIPIVDIEDPASAGATLEDAQAFAAHVYRAGSKGDYVDRHFLVNLTRCPIDGSGSFEFDAANEYRLQLVLEDASGNVDEFERTIDIP